MPRKILLTGGLGFIGSHTYVELISAGYEVVIFDNLSNSKPSVAARLAQITNHETKFIEGDVLDQRALSDLFEAHDFDAVVHFAALKAVGESVEMPAEYHKVNIAGLLTLLEVMERNAVENIVFSSSAAVYGNDNTSPMTEDMPKGFSSPYAFTKAACEDILLQISEARKLNVGILRYFNPAGAHASGLIGEDPNDIPNNLMPYIERVADGRADHLRVWGDDYNTPDGTGVRDYIHVVDLARGHVLSLDALLEKEESHLVNLGRGQGASVLEVLASYSKACGRELPYKIYPRRAGDVETLYASCEKALKVLGFEATHDLDAICASSWAWVQKGAALS